VPLVQTGNETVKVQKEYQVRIGNEKIKKILKSISGLVCYLKKEITKVIVKRATGKNRK
jgi:hypothetical protein